ncbi:MAG: AsmA-like C-terminal region-containing protein [Bacteroidia bacterium]
MNNEVNTPLAPIPEKKSPLWARFLLKVIVIVFSLFFLVLTGTFVIGYYYQNEVKDVIVAELNKQLNTQVIVNGKDIDFTVIKNFPYASVEFKNIKALEVAEKKKKDTLFSAGNISFQFNIVDVFKKKYEIKKIEANRVDIQIVIDKKGNDNYHFWKTTPDTTTNNAFAFNLKMLELNEVRLVYKNKKTNQLIAILINTSNSSGKFSSEKYTMQTQSKLLVSDFQLNNVSYLSNKAIELDMAVNIDNTTDSYKLKSGKIKIEDLLFEAAGTVINSNNESIVNIGVKGKNMNIQSVLSLIPNEYKNRINDYESKGEFYFNAIVEGVVSKYKTPQIKADFGIKNAEISHVKNNIQLHQVNLEGAYYSGNTIVGDSSFLQLKSFDAKVGSTGHISGQLSIKNIDNPIISAKIKGEIALEKLNDFIAIDTLESINGNIIVDAFFSGKPDEFNDKNYRNIRTSGTLHLENTSVKIKNNPLDFNKLNGDFTFDNNDLIINKFSGNASDSDFELKGELKNIVGFVMNESDDVTIVSTLKSKKLNLNELVENKETSTKAESDYKLKFSEHINVVFNSEIEELVFRKFNASNIKGLVTLKNKKLSVDSLAFNTMGGKIITSGLVDATDSTAILVSCFADLQKIDITRFFVAFENFEQDYITDKNVKGKVSAKIQYASIYTPELNVDLDKLYAGIDMTIENGELNNVESMKSLSRFIDLKDLENIRFSTLHNQLEVKNKMVAMPVMEIKSNAMNVFASGTHSFENEINYRIKLSLNELLAKKIKKPKEQNTEFGEIADDGLGRTNLFLLMTGTVDKPIIKYDTKGAVQNIKQNLKVEKQSLKKILNEEFGLFKKDSSLNKNKPNKALEDKKITIKWEEQEPKKEEKKELKKPKRKEEEDF